MSVPRKPTVYNMTAHANRSYGKYFNVDVKKKLIIIIIIVYPIQLHFGSTITAHFPGKWRFQTVGGVSAYYSKCGLIAPTAVLMWNTWILMACHFETYNYDLNKNRTFLSL